MTERAGGDRDLGGAQHRGLAVAAAPARGSATARRRLYLAYDTLQLGVLLFLTGGLQIPSPS